MFWQAVNISLQPLFFFGAHFKSSALIKTAFALGGTPKISQDALVETAIVLNDESIIKNIYETTGSVFNKYPGMLCYVHDADKNKALKKIVELAEPGSDDIIYLSAYLMQKGLFKKMFEMMNEKDITSSDIFTPKLISAFRKIFHTENPDIYWYGIIKVFSFDHSEELKAAKEQVLFYEQASNPESIINIMGNNLNYFLDCNYKSTTFAELSFAMSINSDKKIIDYLLENNSYDSQQPSFATLNFILIKFQTLDQHHQQLLNETIKNIVSSKYVKTLKIESENKILYTLVKTENTDLLKSFIDHGMSPKIAATGYKDLIHYAKVLAYYSPSDEILEILNILDPDFEYTKPQLYWPWQEKQIIAQIKSGELPLNYVNEKFENIVLLSARYNDAELLQMAIDAGFKLDYIDMRGKTAQDYMNDFSSEYLKLFINHMEINNKAAILMIGSDNIPYEEKVAFIKRYEIDLNDVHKEYNLYHFAVSLGSKDIIKLADEFLTQTMPGYSFKHGIVFQEKLVDLGYSYNTQKDFHNSPLTTHFRHMIYDNKQIFFTSDHTKIFNALFHIEDGVTYLSKHLENTFAAGKHPLLSATVLGNKEILESLIMAAKELGMHDKVRTCYHFADMNNYYFANDIIESLYEDEYESWNELSANAQILLIDEGFAEFDGIEYYNYY